jgi:flagellar protein FlaG
METKAALTPSIPEPSAPTPVAAFTVPGQPAGGHDVSGAKEKPAAASGPQPGDLRLVIEQDPSSGTFVYKTVDRRTGDVLQQFPREDVLRFKQAEHYDPGEVFDGLS